ncbi:glycoside hydrolase family 3 N-terminal domain-containing protein [Actinomadura viridis]|uniref:Beta-glucosidase-like glycosyl hydrolase n=1 Tax=Actinomadura viridis TaxID=58110 RepID=A0A931DNK8_9ACTN|nr:glycoside hydrolase family 3 N-terminal domain-containing protein [Actinomadura viridis]MBG6092902.1 beta-glucosidase-like glycosyl hydrolase [Actinomadura viridis]
MTEALPAARPAGEPWRDRRLPVPERVADLLSRMTVEEKAAQLGGFWATQAAPGEPVAPVEDDSGEPAPDLDEIVRTGLGQLTRVFGTAPVAPGEGAARLRELQRRVAGSGRFPIAAIAHEECLTGFMAWGATVFPSPPAWGATFDPELVAEMAAAVGASIRGVGAHMGLAPVLDVVRDARWGRTEECVGEDPYLVGVIGAAYVRGLEGAGVVATLKHFAGYSASRAARNMAPAALGPREFADVVLEPFVLALREGGARAVMHSYTDVDGMPAAADRWLLTDLLRGELGFTGIVVSDYYGISFLESRHRVAGSRADAAALALRAGIDMELPTVRCYGAPLVEAVRGGAVPESLLDRAATRVLTLKAELGLLGEGGAPGDLAHPADPGDPNGFRDPGGLREPGVPGEPAPGPPPDLDPPAHRALARRLAEESVVLLADDGALPLPVTARIALAGPLADDVAGMMGCYTFPTHVGRAHPDVPLGVEIPTLAEALRDEFPAAAVRLAASGEVLSGTDADAEAGIDAAVAAALDADVCVLALGDRAGLFGRGTSGEGCDAETFALPGRQADLAKAVLDTGTPTVVVVLSGRPYALGDIAGRAAAVLQAFFPGEEGARAVAGILSGRLEPSGRLPLSVPRTASSPSPAYLRSRMESAHDWSTIDPAPLYPFGHGLSWTRFDYGGLEVDERAPTDGQVTVRAVVRNVGDRPGTEVVQLYLADPVASVVRPERLLAGWARLRLEAGAAARVEFTVHADRTSFTGPDLRRVVEPGVIEVEVGRSSGDLPLRGSFTLHGPVREPGPDRVLTVPVRVVPL